MSKLPLWTLSALLLVGGMPLHAQSTYVVTGATSETNGSNGNVIDGGDTLNVTTSGAISTISSVAPGVQGILANGDNNTLNLNGTITTTGPFGHGVFINGDQNIIHNDGDISTASTGNVNNGVRAFGVGNQLLNTGTVSTTGGFFSPNSASSAVAFNGANSYVFNDVGGVIQTSGDTAQGVSIGDAGASQVINHGTISTENANANAIVIGGGNGAQVDNFGLLQTMQNFSNAVSVHGADTHVMNHSTGVIETGGINSIGIHVVGHDAVIQNSGAVQTNGLSGDGIIVEGEESIVVNSGSITSYDSGVGIRVNGDNAQITNLGANSYISVNGNSKRGIEYFGSGGVISNQGLVQSLSITSSDSSGILVSGPGNTVDNTGIIEINGVVSHGIVTLGGSNNTNNSGSISTSGSGSHGILSASGISTNITNSGFIQVSGDGSHGILSTGTIAVVTNSGEINSEAAIDTAAVKMEGTGNTLINSGNLFGSLSGYSALFTGSNANLTLEDGSILQGLVGFSGANNSLTLSSFPDQIIVTTQLPDTITTTSGNPYFTVGTTVMSFDLVTSAASGFNAAYHTADVIQVATAHHLDRRNEQGMQNSSRFWVSPFGKRSDFNFGVPQDLRLEGVVAGFDLSLSDQTLLGMYATYTRGLISTGLAQENIKGSYTGAYLRHSFGRLELDGGIMFGQGSTNSTRTVLNNLVLGGVETLDAKDEGRVFSSWMMARLPVETGWGVFTPEIGVRHSSYHTDGLQMSGVPVALPGLEIRNTELNLGARLTPGAYDTSFGTFEPSLKLGVILGRNSVESDDQVFTGTAHDADFSGTYIVPDLGIEVRSRFSDHTSLLFSFDVQSHLDAGSSRSFGLKFEHAF